MKYLSENLQYLMDRHSYSQQSLHRASGVSQASIRSMIEMQHSPSLSVIARVAKIFNLLPWQIIGPPSLLQGLPPKSEQLINAYALCDESGQETILRVAGSLALSKPQAGD